MKSTQKILLIASTLLVLNSVVAGSAWADSLSDQKNKLQQKQQQAKHLQSQLNSTSQQIDSQKKKTKSLQQSLAQTQNALTQTKQNITLNQQQQNQLQVKITGLTQQIEQTQTKLTNDEQDVNQMLRASYEEGSVPYLYVLVKSTSFSDLLGRLTLLATVAKSEKTLLNQVMVLHKKLDQEQSDQRASLHELQLKGGQLFNMQQAEVTLSGQKKHSITLVNQSISQLQQQEAAYSQEMHLTQQQVADLKQQIQEEEAIQATQSGDIVEANLRYQDVSAQKIYDYVTQKYNSTFTLSDIETICQAANDYNVNPILLVAITGQEQDFVPAGSSAAEIRKNPFNVYYSWQWTMQYRPSWGLSDTAAIAANTVRHKLSVPAPAGEDVFDWLNDPKNPWGLYATNTDWSTGVRWFFNSITNYVNS